MIELPPLSLYVHIPFCERKCPYCDFNSHVSAVIPEELYVQKLINDLQSQQTLACGRPLTSLFIGGGTPSLFSVQAIAAILTAAEKLIGFSDKIEITMEVNPSSAEQKSFYGLKAAGINRLSIGVQSFNNSALKQLGRVHDAAEAKQAITHAQDAGFTRINIDLMHGLPEQHHTDALKDLNTAIDFSAEHISWYQLTIEPNTEFYHLPPKLPDDDMLSNIQDSGSALLAEKGYQQYEVSAYAANNRVAKHNLNYWRFGDYLAIGAGAHGKCTAEDGEIIRFNNTRTPKDYLARQNNFRAKTARLKSQTALFEALLNGLRLKQGICMERLCLATGANTTIVEAFLQPAIKKKLVALHNQRILPTTLGYRHLNTVLEMLIQPDN